jgi:enoyl-CoA hydratase
MADSRQIPDAIIRPEGGTMSKKEPFKVVIDKKIAWLILNRSDKFNAMGFDFFDSLVTHFTKFDEDPSVRVVVIRAEGKHFTAGLDLAEAGALLTSDKADGREALRKKILDLQESMNVIERCRKPVIAAVHSRCIGGGVDLLSACDIRMASADAVFSIRETRLAIIADLGTLQRLPHIIGHGFFRELALTGRDFTAQEALNMGFVTHVCPDRNALYAEAEKVAGQVARNAPLTVQGVKDVINFSRDNGVYPGLNYVAQKNAAAIISDDLMEAVAAFMEKRQPVFKGR